MWAGNGKKQSMSSLDAQVEARARLYETCVENLHVH